MRFRLLLLAALSVPGLVLALASRSQAQQPAADAMPVASTSMPGRWNLPVRTLGGIQYWGDELVLSGWRVQRNAVTGHCRLLDPDDRRHAWGTLAECRAALEVVRQAKGLPATQGRVVLVLHGLGGCRPMMGSLCDHLREQGRLETVAIAYPSTRLDVDAAAASLGRVVSGLSDADEIDFVAHSLGSIVLRRYLAMNTDAAAGRRPDPRIKRIVMLAPPNHGAPEAGRLALVDFSGQLAGPAARQLTSEWRQLEPKLVTPTCEFGILAGGRGNGDGFNKLLPGDNDGVVTVESTKLAGARDFCVVPALHVLFMRNPQVQQLTLRFLQQGHFETDARRKPL